MPAMGSADDLGTSLDELSEVVTNRDPGAHIVVTLMVILGVIQVVEALGVPVKEGSWLGTSWIGKTYVLLI